MANFTARAQTAFDMIFRPSKFKEIKGYFGMLDGYTPVWTTYSGGVYEMELTRSCIHTFAEHCSKLLPTVNGADLAGVQRILDTKPNPFMISAAFLYKTATIYDAQNTCWIVPLLDEYDKTKGFYPVAPTQVELVAVEGTGEPWIRFTFGNGKKGALELSRCGVVSKYLYTNDIVGEDNRCLQPTMQLLALQNQGISEGIKSGASFRFMGNLKNFLKMKDLIKERDEFVKGNLGPDSGGLVLFPSTYENVKQIVSNPKIVDSEQMKLIQTRAFDYFGSNEEILQNKAVGDSWSAYYEGKIEPFAIKLSQAMTCMSYTDVEISRGNAITWSANRMQYMTNKDKLETSSQLFDRGILTTNQVMDIWNLPHVENGDKRFIRKEYLDTAEIEKTEGETNGNTSD